LQLLVHTEEAVVKFGVSSRVDPTEVIHARKLTDGVCDELSELERAASEQRFHELTILVEIRKSLHEVLK